MREKKVFFLFLKILYSILMSMQVPWNDKQRQVILIPNLSSSLWNPRELFKVVCVTGV